MNAFTNVRLIPVVSRMSTEFKPSGLQVQYSNYNVRIALHIYISLAIIRAQILYSYLNVSTYYKISLCPAIDFNSTNRWRSVLP